MEQIDFFDTAVKKSDEFKAFSLIKPQIMLTLEQGNINPDWLQFNEGKAYASVLIKSNTVLQLKFGRKSQYFASPYKYFREWAERYSYTMHENSYARFALNSPEDIENYMDLSAYIFYNAINMLPTDFHCCNRFNECSDARQCIHPDKEFSAECYYKRVLRSGRVFFGKNRNID